MQSANPLWEARNCHLQGREGQKQPRHGAKARLDAGDASCTSRHDFFYSCTGEGASNIQAVDSYMRAVLRCSTEVLAEKAGTIFTRLQQQFGSGNPCPECQTVPAPSFGGPGSGGRGINISDCDYGGDMDASVMPSVPAADHNYLHTSPRETEQSPAAELPQARRQDYSFPTPRQTSLLQTSLPPPSPAASFHPQSASVSSAGLNLHTERMIQSSIFLLPTLQGIKKGPNTRAQLKTLNKCCQYRAQPLAPVLWTGDSKYSMRTDMKELLHERKDAW